MEVASISEPHAGTVIDTSVAHGLDALSHEEYIKLAYMVVLGRLPEADGLAYYGERLRGQIIARKTLVRMLFESPEYMAQFAPSFPDRLHDARKLMVSQLPKADVIVDLGGSCPTDIEGALYVMGYPHRAKRLIIVDLPFDTRMVVPIEFKEGKLTRDFGTIEYVHSSMTDLSAVESGTVDMVFSGESIEHVTEEEGMQVFAEAMRVLKPGGTLWLDTPNSKLTRIHVPEKFIHPEHKLEYTPEQLAVNVKAAGFEVLEVKGICPMPETVATGVFDPTEPFRTEPISDNPDISYCFYVKARKPT